MCVSSSQIKALTQPQQMQIYDSHSIRNRATPVVCVLVFVWDKERKRSMYGLLVKSSDCVRTIYVTIKIDRS